MADVMSTQAATQLMLVVLAQYVADGADEAAYNAAFAQFSELYAPIIPSGLSYAAIVAAGPAPDWTSGSVPGTAYLTWVASFS